MKNKILVSIFLCTILLSALSAQTSYKKTLEEDLMVIADIQDDGGFVIKLDNLKNGASDTVHVFHPLTKLKAIKDIWFDSSICGLIMESDVALFYYLYTKDESGWRHVAGQILIDRTNRPKAGFGGVKLLDPFTFVITYNYRDGSKKVIYQYDAKGNRTTFKQTEFKEAKH